MLIVIYHLRHRNKQFDTMLNGDFYCLRGLFPELRFLDANQHIIDLTPEDAKALLGVCRNYAGTESAYVSDVERYTRAWDTTLPTGEALNRALLGKIACFLERAMNNEN